MSVTDAKMRSFSDFALFGLAWIFLAIAAFCVRFLPFRLTCRWMEAPARPMFAHISPEQVVRAVERACVRCPWRSVCIHQGIVAHRLLRRTGHSSQFVYGISPPPDRLSAHVWVRLNDRILVGGSESGGFHEVMALPN